METPKIHNVMIRVWFKDGRYIEKEYDGSDSIQWSCEDVEELILDINY